MIIPEGGDKRCNKCKRKKRDAQKEADAVDEAIWHVVLLNEATRGPPPEAEDDAEADDDNVMFRAAGE